jgi:quinoprotein glucose dehydrogenase
VGTSEADELLGEWMDRLIRGDDPLSLQLDLLEAVEKRAAKSPLLSEKLAAFRKEPASGDPLQVYRMCLEGGDAVRGARIFFDRADVSCRRCHNVEGVDVSVGPNLRSIGREKTREYLLESIVDPSRTIAEGFQSTILFTAEGKVISGIVRGEDERHVDLVLESGEQLRIAKEEIDERATGKSAMPEDLVKLLSPRDLRDLVEYLSSLKSDDP